VLTTQGDRLSLRAVEVPLQEVIERIGQALHIPVAGSIGTAERVSIEFQDLPLNEALQRLSPNHALLLDEAGGRVTRILLFAPGQAAPAQLPRPPAQTGETGRAELDERSRPFEFTFDPSKYWPGDTE
jgi:hypothetical protein